MSGSVAFIQECLTAERERRGFNNSNNNYVPQPSDLHTLQERQWVPVPSGNDRQSPLALCWDNSGLYCAEGSNKGSIIVWNFAQNTAPYNVFDRLGFASFVAADGDQQQQSAKSACIAWSESCHHIYMASNYSSLPEKKGSDAESRECDVCIVSCWGLNSGELPLHSTRLSFEVQAVQCISGPSPHTLALVSSSGHCYLANASLNISNLLSFDTATPSAFMTLSLRPPSPRASPSPAVTVRRLCSARYLTDMGVSPSMFALVSSSDPGPPALTRWRLLHIDTMSFAIMHDQLLASYTPFPTCTRDIRSHEQSADSMEVCLASEADLGQDQAIECDCFLELCPLSSEVLVSISSNCSNNTPSLLVCSAHDASICHDFSFYFSKPCETFGAHTTASTTSTKEEKQTWLAYQMDARASIVGAGFMKSSKYSSDRHIAVCFNINTSASKSQVVPDQWTCYFKIADSIDDDPNVKETKSSTAVPLVVCKSAHTFAQFITSYQSSCLIGIHYAGPTHAASSPALVLYAADEKLYSYFAGASFPVGFVVLDRPQLYIEHEDETDIVVRKDRPVDGFITGHPGKGKKHVEKRGLDSGGTNSRAGKRMREATEENNLGEVIDVWSNESPCSKVDHALVVYEEIDQQGFELERYLNQEMLRRQQWIGAGGWTARALPPVSVHARQTSGIFDGAMGRSQALFADANAVFEEVLPKSQSGGSLVPPVVEESNDICFLTGPNGNVPHRVISRSQNIALRAAMESQVNRRILGTIFKTCDKATEIKKRIADSVADARRSKQERKDNARKMTQDIDAVMELLIKTTEERCDACP